MVALSEIVKQALAKEAGSPVVKTPRIAQFAKRANVTLEKNGAFLSSKNVLPGRKAAHGGGVSSATLRMSHNTPSVRRG